MTCGAAVVGTLKGQDGRDTNELKGLTVPVKLAGPFEKLSYTVDWGAVNQSFPEKKFDELLRNATGKVVKRELRDRLQAEAGREPAVERRRGDAALDVAEDRHPGLVAGALLDLVGLHLQVLLGWVV